MPVWENRLLEMCWLQNLGTPVNGSVRLPFASGPLERMKTNHPDPFKYQQEEIKEIVLSSSDRVQGQPVSFLTTPQATRAQRAGGLGQRSAPPLGRSS